MLNIKCAVLVLVSALTSGPLFAQSNVGELRDAGAHLLGKSDVVALLHDTTWESGGDPIHTEYRADGTFTEFIQVTSGVHQGQGKGHFGKWSVDASGKECEMRKNFKGEQRCHYWFSLGDRFFVAQDPEDRSERAAKRNLKK